MSKANPTVPVPNLSRAVEGFTLNTLLGHASPHIAVSLTGVICQLEESHLFDWETSGFSQPRR